MKFEVMKVKEIERKVKSEHEERSKDGQEEVTGRKKEKRI